MEFNEIKAEILARAKKAGARISQYERAYNSESMTTFCGVIKDNFRWYCRAGIIDGELLTNNRDQFAEHDIYVNVSVNKGYLLAYGSATVEACGSATVEAYGSAIKAYDSATVKAYGSATVEAYDSTYIDCHTTVECKLSDNAVARRWDTDTIEYVNPDMKFNLLKQ